MVAVAQADDRAQLVPTALATAAAGLHAEVAAATGRGSFADRLTRLGRARLATSVMGNFLVGKDDRRAEKCNHCGKFLQFHHYPRLGDTRLAQAYLCQQWKLCPLCGIRRGAKKLDVIVRKIRDVLLADDAKRKVVEAEGGALEAWDRLRVYHVTLTMKDEADCAEMFEKLANCQRRYLQRRRDHLRGKGDAVEANKAVGIFASFETKRGQGSGLWHWHTHQVWLVRGRIDFHALKAEWYDVTGDSYQCHVEEMKFSRAGDLSDQAMGRDLAEVCKYAMKPSEMNQQDAWDMHQATEGRHFTRTVGTLRFSAEETERIMATDRDDQLEGEPFEVHVYRWWKGGGRYVRLLGSGLDRFQRPLRDQGSADVNRACELRARSRGNFAQGPGGAAPWLDTGVKFGDGGDAYRRKTGDDPPEGSPPPGRDRPQRAVRLASEPAESENAFA